MKLSMALVITILLLAACSAQKVKNQDIAQPPVVVIHEVGEQQPDNAENFERWQREKEAQDKYDAMKKQADNEKLQEEEDRWSSLDR
jgi:uncharacterized protein YxeA